MRGTRWMTAFCGFFALLVSPLMACLWDYDTLQQERSRFPNTLELITGWFPRHSDAFYHWRLQDRTSRLAKNPEDKEAYDDLAVAYEKLGDHKRAIEIIQQKEERWPGEYETAANYGTFLIHQGKFKEGLVEIRRAIEINPDAHFGREIYQQKLVEYVLSCKGEGDEGVSLPLTGEVPLSSYGMPKGFAEFVLASKAIDLRDSEAVAQEIALAQKGVLGMMRFGNHDSPILLEALASLLLVGREQGDAKRLAVRALLKASEETKGEVSAAYRELAADALDLQTIKPGNSQQIPLAQVADRFSQELQAAEEWYAELERDEKRWIEEGADPEAKFQEKYASKPQVQASFSSTGTKPQGQFLPRWTEGVSLRWLGILGAIAVLVPLAVFVKVLKRMLSRN